MFVGVAWYVWKSGSPVAEQARILLSIDSGLSPIALSASEQQALKNDGITPPSSTDAGTAALQSVGTSDRVSSIEADLNRTDLSGLDAELNQIQQDLAF